MKYSKRTISFFLLISIVGCLIFWYVSQPKSKEKNKKKKVPLVSISTVQKKDISEILELTGEVVVTNRVTIKTTVTGVISYCPWREGDSVKAGEILIRIERPLLIAEMEAKEAALGVEKAKLEDLKAGARPEEILRAKHDVTKLRECDAYTKKDLERNTKLNLKGAVSKEAVEIAKVAYMKCSSDLLAAMEQLKILKKGATKTQIAVLEAQVKEAEAQYKILKEKVLECKINAPFGGIISRVFVRKGDLVREGREDVVILEMIDPLSIMILFHVPEQYAHLLEKNFNVSILVDSLKGEYVDSNIARIYPEVDNATHTLAVEASLNVETKVSPGMFVRVKLPIRSAENALVVPDSALLTDQNGKHSIFILKNGKVEKRKVEKGLESGALVRITKGISLGDTVITAGNYNLKNGATVRVKEKPLSKLSGNRKKGQK